MVKDTEAELNRKWKPVDTGDKGNYNRIQLSNSAAVKNYSAENRSAKKAWGEHCWSYRHWIKLTTAHEVFVKSTRPQWDWAQSRQNFKRMPCKNHLKNICHFFSIDQE